MKLFLSAIVLLLFIGWTVEARMLLPPLSDNITQPLYKEKSEEKKSIPQLIEHYADHYGVSSVLATKIAKCESGLNPNAKNKNSSAGGLYQFINATWNSNSKRYLGHIANKYDAESNIRVAMAKISNEGTNAWKASKHCRSK